MSTNQMEAKSFFAGLFDFGFTSFITLKFLRVIYTVLVILSILGALFVFIALANRGGGGVIFGLIVAPVVALFYIVVARVYLELVAVLFRIGENTALLAQQGAIGAGPVSGYGTPPLPQ